MDGITQAYRVSTYTTTSRQIPESAQYQTRDVDVIKQIYDEARKEAKTQERKDEISAFILYSIVENFEALAKKDAASPDMPEQLQAAIVVFIMSKKMRGELSISQEDVTTALQELEKHKSEINVYLHDDIGGLLAKGIELYNNKMRLDSVSDHVYFDINPFVSYEERELFQTVLHQLYTLLFLRVQGSLKHVTFFIPVFKTRRCTII